MTNKVILIGNVATDPKFLTISNGINKCDFVIAVDKRNKDSSKTNFFNVTTWRGLADVCEKYLKKGRKICVSGELDTRKFTTKDGVEKLVTEIVADDIEFLSSNEINSNKQSEASKQVLGPISDDNLPFDV